MDIIKTESKLQNNFIHNIVSIQIISRWKIIKVNIHSQMQIQTWICTKLQMYVQIHTHVHAHKQ